MTDFKVGDICRVKQLKGELSDTLWIITEMLSTYGCMIKEYGTNYKEQRFDTSLLKVVK